MSDSELSEGAVLVQIGVAFSATERYCSVLGWKPGTYRMTEAGMAAHGISVEEIAAGPAPEAVDAELFDWLCARGASTESKVIVPVGFNVGAFDLPFVQAYLPRTYSVLSRRVCDLNSPVYLYGGAVPLGGSRPNSSGWKRMAKRWAAKQLAEGGVAEAWHEAGYDAAAAILMVDFFRAVARGEVDANGDVVAKVAS